MSPEGIELLRRIQGLERQINARPASIERANSPMIDRFGGTVGGLTGVVRWNGGSPSWTQSTAADIDDQSRIGYAVMVNSGKPTVYLQGALWIDHAFAAGLPLYCSPSSAGELTATKPTADGDSTRVIAYAGAGGWIWLANTGEAQAKALTSLSDVDIDPEDLEEDDVISWDATAEKWVINTVGEIGLGERLATSVVGRSANSAGAAADIQATVNDRYFGRKADALGFFQVAWGDLDLTGASLALGGDLDDTTDDATVVGIQGEPVNATAPVDNDIFVYDDEAEEWVPSQIITIQGALLTVIDDDGLAIRQLPPGEEGQVLTGHGEDENLTWGFPFGPPRGTITQTSYTSGSGTHTFTKRYFAAMIIGAGGGAGGGNGTAFASGNTSAGGGGAGGVAYLFGEALPGGSMSAAYAVGAAGSGGSPGGSGTAGGNSSFAGILAYGGGAGQAGIGDYAGGAGGGAGSFSGSGSPAVAFVDADLSFVVRANRGQSGQPGRVTSVTHTAGSVNSVATGPGPGGAGVPNTVYGYGGNGGSAGSSGSNGQAGVVIICEWD